MHTWNFELYDEEEENIIETRSIEAETLQEAENMLQPYMLQHPHLYSRPVFPPKKEKSVAYKEAGSLYNQYIQEARDAYNASFDASQKQFDHDVENAARLYPNRRSSRGETKLYKALYDEAQERANQREDRICKKWAEAKREALERLRPYAPADFLEAME